MPGFHSNKALYTIYSVEDDPNIGRIVNLTLKREGYDVKTFPDGQSFLKAYGAKRPDMILMDLMLPDYSGEDLISKVRAEEGGDDVEILIVSAKNLLADKLEGLERGADDYIEKPFDLLELIARVNAHYRHSSKSHVLTYGELSMDRDQRAVFYKGATLNLTNSEFIVLERLLSKVGEVVTRDEMITILWGENPPLETRTIDMHVKELRKKLSDSGGRLIQTVYGIGYRLGSKSHEDPA